MTTPFVFLPTLWMNVLGRYDCTISFKRAGNHCQYKSWSVKKRPDLVASLPLISTLCSIEFLL
jgi:hypothetical protein